MKADERTMTVATGLVLAIGIGFLAQNSGAIMTALSGAEFVAVADDKFTVLAGKPQALDVLANDAAAPSSKEFRIVRQPICGSLARTGDEITYGGSEHCSGPVYFSYCILVDGTCETAGVTLNVIAPTRKRRDKPVVLAAVPEPDLPASRQAAVPAHRSLDTLRNSVLSALNKPLADAATTETESEILTQEETPPGNRTDGRAQPILADVQHPPPEEAGGEYSIAAARQSSAPLLPDFAALPERDSGFIADLPPTGPVEPADSTEVAAAAAVTGDAPRLSVIETASKLELPEVQTRVARFSKPELVRPAEMPDGFAARPIVEAKNEYPQDSAGPTAQSVELSGPARRQLPVHAVQTAPAPCPVSLDVVATTGASLQIAVNSACKPHESFTIEHASISFSGVTDAEGRALLMLPALTRKATVRLAVADGTERTAAAMVPDMDRYLRVAISWDGPADIDLHAFEFGADADNAGHVWAGAPRSYREARKSGGGYLTVLGGGARNGSHAEIYTLPLFRRAENGIVEMSLALNGTAGCGEALALRAVRSRASVYMAKRNLRLKVADCGGHGDPVFIANAIDDLRVASRR